MAEIIEMPKLSDTMSTGTLVKWLKKEGDTLSAGDMIAEVETDKATMEVENFEEGVLLKHYAKEGDSIPVGGPICAVGEKGEEAPPPPDQPEAPSEEDDEEKEDEEATSSEESGESSEKESSEEKETEPAPAPAEASPKKDDGASQSSETSSSSKTEGGRIKASPLAKKIATELGLDLASVQGTGPGGRIVKSDVEAAAKAPKTTAKQDSDKATAGKPLTGLEEKTEKVSNMRASIAKALVKSKQESPHFYLQSEVNSLPIIELRKTLNDKLAGLDPQQGGLKLTVNDLILKASSEAVRRVPEINRSWKGDTIKQHGNVHLAFGVAIDEGLVTPVIREAENKSLRQISSEARELIEKARNRKLKPDEMTNSTLTVTNLGMFGITDFYGIINPPNAAILSVGATIKTPIVNDQDEIEIGYRMKIGLSGDHRVIDGAVGAQYLAALKEILESPALMLV